MIVHGAIQKELHIASGPQCFGPGWVSNASIGRALNLLVRHARGANGTDPAAFSSPDAYSFCFGEDHENSPWEPWQRECGLSPEQSAVTVHEVIASLPSHDQTNRTPEGVLTTLCQTLRSRPALAGRWAEGQLHVAFVVAPEQQRVFAGAGWSRSRMRAQLWSQLERADAARWFHASTPDSAPIIAAGGPGMSWIWILVSHTLAPTTRAIAQGAT